MTKEHTPIRKEYILEILRLESHEKIRKLWRECFPQKDTEQSLDLQGEEFTSIVWEGLYVIGVDFTKAHFFDMTMNGCHFTNCIFTDGTFECCCFEDTRFNECTFHRTQLDSIADDSDAMLNNSDMADAEMKNIDFAGWILNNVNFTGANLYNASFHYCDTITDCTWPETDTVIPQTIDMPYHIHLTRHWCQIGCQERKVGEWMNLTRAEFLDAVSNSDHDYEWFCANRDRLKEICDSLTPYKEDTGFGI